MPPPKLAGRKDQNGETRDQVCIRECVERVYARYSNALLRTHWASAMESRYSDYRGRKAWMQAWYDLGDKLYADAARDPAPKAAEEDAGELQHQMLEASAELR